MNPDVVSKPMRDPYHVLGLARQATEEDIKRAYFQLVRQFSPERAPEQFREIRTAYEQLRDPDNRARLGLFCCSHRHRSPNNGARAMTSACT